MATKEKIIDDLNFVTDRISTQVRTLALGVLAFIWGIVISDSEMAKSIAQPANAQLLGIAGGAVLTMLLDFFQYIPGFINTRNLLSKMERTKATEGTYDYSSWGFRLRNFFFWGKVVVLTITVLGLLRILAWRFFNV
jgi:hypothetical protein